MTLSKEFFALKANEKHRDKILNSNGRTFLQVLEETPDDLIDIFIKEDKSFSKLDTLYKSREEKIKLLAYRICFRQEHYKFLFASNLNLYKERLNDYCIKNNIELIPEENCKIIRVIDNKKIDNKKMANDLKGGNKFEDEVAEYFLKKFSGYIKCIDFPKGYFKEYDFAITFINEEKITFEIKSDSKSYLTENTCLEFRNNGVSRNMEQNCSDKEAEEVSQGFFPSGLSSSTADFYVFHFFKNQNLSANKNISTPIVMFPTNILRQCLFYSFKIKENNPFSPFKNEPRPVGFLSLWGGDRKNAGSVNIQSWWLEKYGVILKNGLTHPTKILNLLAFAEKEKDIFLLKPNEPKKMKFIVSRTLKNTLRINFRNMKITENMAEWFKEYHRELFPELYQ